MKKTLNSLLALVIGATAVLLTGCGGDSGSATGPASGDAFAGTSISFNPTVNFSAGGNLTYFNDEAGSPFPASDPAADGTYTYVPNATFTGGTLTMTVNGIQSAIVLEISNFTRTGPNVTGFSANSGGQSYPVTVTGTLVAYQPPSGGGGSGGAGESRAPDVPSAMQGTYELTFYASDTPAISGVPADGTVTTFTIGARTLAFGGRTLSDPIHYNNNPYEWIFKDGNIWWAVSEAVNGGLNEINVQGPYTGNGNAFYGQYNDRPPAGSDIQVDGDGKFVPDTSFSAALNSSNSTSSGLAYNNTPALTNPTFFNIDSEGALRVSYGGGGAFSLVVLPFVSATDTTVEYRLQEAGTPSKDYTVTITKDGNNQPTTISASFTLTNGARTTTNTSTLIVQ